MNRLVIIDGNAILHRGYHAMPHLTTSKGDHIGAVFGFTSMLLKVLQELKPTHIVVTFDRPKPTFRKELFIGYQAQREGMDDALVPQIKDVHTVVEGLDIPIFEVDGYEADDLIGTLATQAAKDTTFKNGDIVIVTGDRDIMQLVTDKIHVYAPLKGITEAKMYDVEAVREKFGLSEPHQIIDWKALSGDSSDNYPGVPGIGPKTAAELLAKYHTLENIYHHLGELPERQQKLLAEGAESAALSKTLATIVTEAPISIDIDKCAFHIPDKSSDAYKTFKKRALETFKGFEFKTLTNRFLEVIGEPLMDKEELERFIKGEKDSQQSLF